MKEYEVWVGAWKANDCGVTAYLAQAIKEKWEKEGYNNITIKEIR